mmetsp:Transcript_30375/g.83671  ORF Transcript_30375/g.83671 Transcript_30375/m.83671 type:complete len:410 (-) Transcript_30375:50-1279(-)
MLPACRLLLLLVCLADTWALVAQSLGQQLPEPCLGVACHERLTDRSANRWGAEVAAAREVHSLAHRTLKRSLASNTAMKVTSPWVCVAMSLLAGLSTTLGAAAVLLLPGQRVSRRQMAFALALAGGVMLSVTLLEFWMPMLSGGKRAGPVTIYSVLGAGAYLLLSYAAPEPEVVHGTTDHCRVPQLDLPQDGEDNGPAAAGPPTSTLGRSAGDGPADLEAPEAPRASWRPNCSCGAKAPAAAEEAADEEDDREEDRRRKCRLAVVLMIALTAHNLPEGFAVAVSALHSDRLGLVVMFAIAMHNVPEGISIALPVLSATGSRWKALWMSFLSGMAEPLGATIALLLVHSLGDFLSEHVMENLLCTVGGVMCAVAIKELLPEAWRQRRPGAALLGFALGFLVMIVTNRLGA